MRQDFQFAIKKVDICTETAFSLILGRIDLRGTGAHHLNGDAVRAAETARMHLRASLTGERERLFLIDTTLISV
jgi:hypothetical protein